MLGRKKLLLESKLSWILLLHDHVFELSNVKELGVAETRWAECIVTVHAAIALFVSWNYGLASSAFATRLVVLVWGNHSLTSFVLGAASESINTLWIYTQPKTFFGSAKPHEILSEVLCDIEMMRLQLLKEEIFQAHMAGELTSLEFLVADLALDHNFRTITLDVHE